MVTPAAEAAVALVGEKAAVALIKGVVHAETVVFAFNLVRKALQSELMPVGIRLEL